MSSQIDKIKTLTKFGRGIVFLGPDLFLPSLNYAQSNVFEELRQELSDSTGWESCDEDLQLQLSIADLGRQTVIQKIAMGFPYLEIQNDVAELAKCFHYYRPKYVVDLNFHNAFDSYSIQNNLLFKRVLTDQDLAYQYTGYLPPTLYKMRGDLWLNDACLTISELEEKLANNPNLVRQIQGLCAHNPVFFIGFRPRDHLFNWLLDRFVSNTENVLAFFVSSNRNWKKICQKNSLATLAAPTKNELVQKTSLFFEELQLENAEGIAEVLSLNAKDSLKRTKAIDQLNWLETARSGNRDEIKEARVKLLPISHHWIQLFEKGMVVDPMPICRAIAFQTRSGFGKDAQQLFESAIRIVEAWPLKDEEAFASLGRSLMRDGDEWRGYIALRRSLLSGHLSVEDQADSLAWVSKAVLNRIEDLMVRTHVRAATEQIAQFLNTFAQMLSLSTQDADDDETKWSLYYINLRLGRIMMLASSMAGQSNQVYAQQSVSLLLRTIELVPEKPDGYKYLKPMLTESNSPTYNQEQWARILAKAPIAIQKKLGEFQSDVATV